MGDLLEVGVPHEANGDGAVGQLLVEVLDEGDTSTSATLVAAIEEDLHHLGAVGVALPAASDDVAGGQEVVEDGLVDGGGGAGTLDLLQLVDILRALGDLALGDKDGNSAREALLELGGQGLLDLANQHEVAQGVEDDETLLGEAGGLNLLGSVDVEARKLETQGLVLQLKVVDGLGDLILQGSGVLALQLAELAQMRQVRHPYLLD